MNNSNFNRHRYAIIVGNSSDDFVAYAADLLGEFNVDFVICEDVYSAAVLLRKNRCRNTVVIGRLNRLIKEQCRLIEKVSEYGLICCCLAESSSERKHQQIEQVIETGALVMNEAAELKEIITKQIEAESVFSSVEKKNHKASDFNRHEFAASKAELDALLGA